MVDKWIAIPTLKQTVSAILLPFLYYIIIENLTFSRVRVICHHHRKLSI